MAYINENLFYETILPLTGMDKAALVGISTPLTEANFFSKLLVLKDDDDEPFFKTVHIGLICKDCLKKPDVAEQIKCDHEKHKLPPWKGGARQDRLRKIAEAAGDEARFGRENVGMIVSDARTLFNREDIHKIFADDPKYTKTEDPSLIFMMVDPNAFGPSLTAIVSGYFIYEPTNATNFTGVLLGLDAELTVDSPDMEMLFLQHLKQLKSRFPDKRIIVVPENCANTFASSIVSIVSLFRNVHVLHEHGKEKAGVSKTEPSTRNMVDCFQDALRQEAIKFDARWFTTRRAITASEKSNMIKSTEKILKDTKNNLKDELLRFCVNEKGKMTGKVNGFQDDRAIAFLMFHYWGRQVLMADAGNPYLHLVPLQARHMLHMQLPTTIAGIYSKM